MGLGSFASGVGVLDVGFRVRVEGPDFKGKVVGLQARASWIGFGFPKGFEVLRIQEACHGN